ncbi:MAG: tRNA pseudouridine(38-40) synthase TruA [Nitrospirae bacterium]|nr:tRNA pseudouridine(38-40) synthase TruA [Nitrospirota bacterium]
MKRSEGDGEASRIREAERRIRVTLAFDGTEFSGWQIQKARRTVQGVLEESLQKLLGEPVRVSGCGRIDAGAHANCHVSHFDAHSRMKPDDLRRALNAVLPDDIVVHDVAEASPDFHSRKSAVAKTYEYAIWNAPKRPLRDRRYVWHVPMPLDVEAMRRAASALVGRKDFAAFRNVGSSVKTTVRDLSRIEIDREGSVVRVRATANGFLKQMMRVIVGTLMEVGLGRMEPERIREIVQKKQRSKAGRTAPARGLALVEVEYPRT